MLQMLTSALIDVLCYIVNPRAAFAHVVVGALLYDVYRLHGARVAGVLAVAEECLILLLWLLIPNSWSTILAISVGVYVYERVIGARIHIVDDAIFYSGEQLLVLVNETKFNNNC